MNITMNQEYGRVVVIRRDGTDGPAFPLTASACLFGRWDTGNNLHWNTVLLWSLHMK